MKAESRPVKAAISGSSARRTCSDMVGGEPAAQRYKKVEVDIDGVPYLIECGFGFRPE